MDEHGADRTNGADLVALFNYDQPFQSLTLLPVPEPSAEQIQRFGILLRGAYTNYLELRKMLQEGGYNSFGPLLAEQAAVLSATLTDAIIPHKIDRLPYN